MYLCTAYESQLGLLIVYYTAQLCSACVLPLFVNSIFDQLIYFS